MELKTLYTPRAMAKQPQKALDTCIRKECKAHRTSEQLLHKTRHCTERGRPGDLWREGRGSQKAGDGQRKNPEPPSLGSIESCSGSHADLESVQRAGPAVTRGGARCVRHSRTFFDLARHHYLALRQTGSLGWKSEVCVCTRERGPQDTEGKVGVLFR